MPRRPQRSCLQVGCPALVDAGYCKQHQQRYEAQRGSRHERGYGYAWERLRAIVLRDEPLCRACSAEGRVTAATDVDHVTPKSRGGTDARENLQPLCKACHSRKSALEDGRWSPR